MLKWSLINGSSLPLKLQSGVYDILQGEEFFRAWSYSESKVGTQVFVEPSLSQIMENNTCQSLKSSGKHLPKQYMEQAGCQYQFPLTTEVRRIHQHALCRTINDNFQAAALPIHKQEEIGHRDQDACALHFTLSHRFSNCICSAKWMLQHTSCWPVLWLLLQGIRSYIFILPPCHLNKLRPCFPNPPCSR